MNRTLNPAAFDYLPDIKVNFRLVIDTILPNIETRRRDQYLVSNYVKFKSASKKLRDLAILTSNIPICGVAYKLNDAQFDFKDSRYFCFLPMPETIEKNGLSFHVNGSFGLRDDRSDFKWLTNDNQHDSAAQWNQKMVDEVLNLTLIQMIDYAKELVNKHIEIEKFYSLFPCLSDVGLNWRENYLQPYFSELNQALLILNKKNEWIHIREAFLTNNIEERIQVYAQDNCIDAKTKSTLEQLIYKLFNPSSLSKIATPKHFLEIYEENLKLIENVDICNKLRNDNLLQFDSDEKCILLNFLIQSVNNLSELDDIRLLPLLSLD